MRERHRRRDGRGGQPELEGLPGVEAVRHLDGEGLAAWACDLNGLPAAGARRHGDAEDVGGGEGGLGGRGCGVEEVDVHRVASPAVAVVVHDLRLWGKRRGVAREAWWSACSTEARKGVEGEST